MRRKRELAVLLAVTVICSLFGANSAYTAASERTREQGETSKEGWAQESVVYGAGVDSTEGTEEPVNRERATLEFVESDYDRYASAAKWFREAADSYLIAGIYCDISDCLELINQYNGAKIKQTEKMYEEYGKLWVMIGELKEKAGEFDSVDSKLQVWSEINTMIDTKAAQFLEITTKEELMELLKSISSEAGKVDKSIIREDMEELKDAIKETVRKLETAEEKEVQT